MSINFHKNVLPYISETNLVFFTIIELYKFLVVKLRVLYEVGVLRLCVQVVDVGAVEPVLVDHTVTLEPLDLKG